MSAVEHSHYLLFFRPPISLSCSGKRWKCHLPTAVIKPCDFRPGVSPTQLLSLPSKNCSKTSFLLQVIDADVHNVAGCCHSNRVCPPASPPAPQPLPLDEERGKN